MLAGEPADDLDPSTGLTEGALDEVRVADPVPILGRPQVHGERCQVVGDAGDRRGVAGLPLGGELGGLLVGDGDGLVTGLGVADIEDGPKVGLFKLAAIDRQMPSSPSSRARDRNIGVVVLQVAGQDPPARQRRRERLDEAVTESFDAGLRVY